jgi:hypothetical protein
LLASSSSGIVSTFLLPSSSTIFFSFREKARIYSFKNYSAYIDSNLSFCFGHPDYIQASLSETIVYTSPGFDSFKFFLLLKAKDFIV